MKRYGVLCDGGDAPGINAAIRAIAREAFEKDDEMLGFIDGFIGLIKNDVKIITKDVVSGILPLSGSVLGISRINPFRNSQNIQAIKENFKKNSLTLLVIIGDRDTVDLAKKFSDEGIPSIVIPKTIDNDVYGTDFAIGFDTAVTTISSALDNLHATASVHHRAMIVETMGRETGWLALFGGISGGADYIIIPEIPYKLEEVASHLAKRKKEGKNFSIVVVAEGVSLPEGKTEQKEYDEFGHPINSKKMVGYTIMEGLEKITHIKARTTVLGYIQRGGIPTNKFADKGKFNGLVGICGRDIVFNPLQEVAGKIHSVDLEFYRLAKTFF